MAKTEKWFAVINMLVSYLCNTTNKIRVKASPHVRWIYILPSWGIVLVLPKMTSPQLLCFDSLIQALYVVGLTQQYYYTLVVRPLALC